MRLFALSRRIAALAALIAAVTIAPAACASTGVDSATRSLLAAHALSATGPTTTMRITIGQPPDEPWDEYRVASAAIGLTEWPEAGMVVELRSTPVASTLPGVRVHVLVVAGAPVGAWQSPEGASPPIHTLDERL